MNEGIKKLNTIYSNMAVRYFCIIIVVFLVFSVFYWKEDMFPFKYFSLANLLLNVVCFFIPYKLRYPAIRPLIPVYFVALSLFVYPFIFVLWQAGHITAFIWYLFIPLGILLFYSIRITIYWSIYVVLLALSIFIISSISPTNFAATLTERQLSIINILTITFCMCFICFIVYYMNKLQTVRISYLEGLNKKVISAMDLKNEKMENGVERYSELYDQIINYFEVEKPYTNPDFNISLLANVLNTNVTYISRAIRANNNMNFNIFVNTYRIDMIKEMLDHDFHNKYTIKYIYIAAGFKHQSTFNKVFKQIEGVTPSEFIKEKYKQVLLIKDEGDDE